MNFSSREPPHLSIYSIAFSLTLGGCLPAVMLAATVGVPQTHLSVRRILCQFEDTQGGLVSASREPAYQIDHFRTLYRYDVRKCLHNGAVPSWRFDRWTWTTASHSIPRQEAVCRPFWREFCAILMVLIGSFGAIALSALVPPTGCTNCRINSELVIMFSYLTSYVLGVVFSKVFKERDGLHFWLVMTKDVCSTLVLTVIILLTGIGSLNQPRCWVTCNGEILLLPEMTLDDVKGLLKTAYPTIIFVTFALLVASWVVVVVLLWDGISVYLQRDDEEVRQIHLSLRLPRTLSRASRMASNLVSSAWKLVQRSSTATRRH